MTQTVDPRSSWSKITWVGADQPHFYIQLQINNKQIERGPKMSKQQEQSLSASTSLKHSSHSSSQLGQPSQPPSPLFTNPSTCAVNNRLNNVLTQIQEKLEEGMIEDSVERLIDLSEKINFMKDSGKPFDPRFQVVCYYNLACAYQMQAFQRTNEDAINDCIANLTQAITLTSDLLKTQQKQQKPQTQPHLHLKLKLFNTKMLLQCCALLSQIENHELALQYGRQALSIITHLFKKAYALAKLQLKKVKENKQKVCGGNGEALVFVESLLIATLGQLEDLQAVEKFQEVMNISTVKFDKIKENSYFWKDNFENNCKTFKKEMKKLAEGHGSGNESPLRPGSSVYYSSGPMPPKPGAPISSIRNCLGMKISNSWVSQLNIGKVMRMTPISYIYFIEPDNISYEFSSRSLIEKIILVCIIYFSIATEMRFLEDGTSPKSPSQQTKKSQLFHFKSIDLAYKYIKEDCPLVDHLITSYLRHYHNTLASIEEKPSFVQHSQLFGEVKKSTLIINGNNENFQDEIGGKGDYMILDLKGEQEEIMFGSGARNTFGGKGSKKISLFDSGELDRGQLVKSVEWSKKIVEREASKNKGSQIQKSVSSESRLKLLKKSSASTKAKDSITLRQQKEANPEPPTQRAHKSKRNNSKSSKKSIIKMIKTQR